MASPEENLASALAKAAEARAAGKEDRAAGWDAAAERYRTIIASKAKIATAKSNIEAIQKKLSSTFFVRDNHRYRRRKIDCSRPALFAY